MLSWGIRPRPTQAMGACRCRPRPSRADSTGHRTRHTLLLSRIEKDVSLELPAPTARSIGKCRPRFDLRPHPTEQNLIVLAGEQEHGRLRIAEPILPEGGQVRMPAARSTAWWPSANRADSPVSSENGKCATSHPAGCGRCRRTHAVCATGKASCNESEALVGDGLSEEKAPDDGGGGPGTKGNVALLIGASPPGRRPRPGCPRRAG